MTTAFTAIPRLTKNSRRTTIAAPGINAAATTIPVVETSVFYRDGVLVLRGGVIGGDNANQDLAEGFTYTGCSATSGPGNLTGVTRAVKADGTVGAGHDWQAGTNIGITLSTDIVDQIADNFANLPQSRNAIINGDCRVNQRVTAYTLAKDVYSWDVNDLAGPDRHEGMATGTAVSAGTFGQSAVSLAGSSGYGFRFSGVTLTGTGIIYQRGRIEAKDAARFKNKIASFSCKVYHDIGSAKNFTVYIRKANSADNFAAVTAIGNSGAISVPNTTDTDLKYENITMGDCSTGIEYEIKGEVGAITTKNIYISEIQIEVSPVATLYEQIPFTVEFSRCMRYFQIYSAASGGLIPNTSFQRVIHGSTTSAIANVGIYPMRAIPTLSTVGSFVFGDSNATFAITNFALVGFTACGGQITGTSSGMTGDAIVFLIASGGAASLIFASEL